jgi:hypothetical protein
VGRWLDFFDVSDNLRAALDWLTEQGRVAECCCWPALSQFWEVAATPGEGASAGAIAGRA